MATVKQNWRPNLTGVAEPAVAQAMQRVYEAVGDHDQAIVTLKAQLTTVAAAMTTTTTAATAAAATAAATAGQVASAIASTFGGVNNQTAAYTLQASDYGGIVTFNSSTAITLTLNPAIVRGFVGSIENLGAGLLTVSPTTGTINGTASISVGMGGGAALFFDGTNWWAMTAPAALVSSVFGRTGAVVAQTGDYTAAQISGLGTMATQNATAVAITGGTINGTTLGASTSTTASVTVLTVSSGGTLTGTFAGTPTFSGAVALSGGGSMAGTFTGTPTFSGAVVFSGAPRFTGVATGLNVTVISGLNTVSVTAAATATVLTGSGALSGLLRFRDNNNGGGAVFLIDPNGGSQLLGTSQITGISTSFNGSNWTVSLASGSFPRTLAWTIYA